MNVICCKDSERKNDGSLAAASCGADIVQLSNSITEISLSTSGGIEACFKDAKDTSPVTSITLVDCVRGGEGSIVASVGSRVVGEGGGGSSATALVGEDGVTITTGTLVDPTRG